LTLDVDTTFGVPPSDSKLPASKTTPAVSSSKHSQTIEENDEQPVRKVKKTTTKGKSRSMKGKKEVKELPTSKTRTDVAATTTSESQDKTVTVSFHNVSILEEIAKVKELLFLDLPSGFLSSPA